MRSPEQRKAIFANLKRYTRGAGVGAGVGVLSGAGVIVGSVVAFRSSSTLAKAARTATSRVFIHPMRVVTAARKMDPSLHKSVTVLSAHKDMRQGGWSWIDPARTRLKMVGVPNRAQTSYSPMVLAHELAHHSGSRIKRYVGVRALAEEMRAHVRGYRIGRRAGFPRKAAMLATAKGMFGSMTIPPASTGVLRLGAGIGAAIGVYKVHKKK